MTKIIIDKKKCTECKLCLNICPMNCYGLENEKVVVKNPEKCIVCRACEIQCPVQAIEVQE